MRTLIVYAHPYAGSFCHALLESTIKGAKAAGHTVDVIDLNADGFDPVMSGADLLGFIKHNAVDPQALDYIARLREADHLVLIFPTWWELMPAIMKGFIDKVIFPGETFDYTASGLGMVSKLSKLQSTTILTTMNTPAIMYKLYFSNAIQRALVRGTLKKMGLKHVKLRTFNMVKGSSDAKRAGWLASTEKMAAK